MARDPARRSLAVVLILAAGSAAAAQPPLVRLQYATFDPLVAEPRVPIAWQAGKSCRIWAVQLQSPPTEAMRQALRERGGEVLHFATDHTYVVRASASAAAAIRAQPEVRWVGAYHAAYRVAPATLSEILAGGREHGGVRYSIEAFDAGPGARGRIAARITGLGGQVDVMPAQGVRMEATLTNAQLLQIAHMDEVNFVDPTGPPGADMDLVRQLVGAVPILSNAGFTGRGVRGEVFDTGIDVNHPAFQSPPPLIHFTNTGFQPHGSAVYGIIFGNGAGNPAGTGLLPDREQGIFGNYTAAATFGGTLSNRDILMQLIEPSGPFRAVFQSRAVGSPHVKGYTTISADMDRATFETDFLVCQSIGDSWNFVSRPESWAKNVMACGSIDHQDTLNRADDTGIANIWAADGRVKPDITGVFDGVLCPSAGGGYTPLTGNSAATAIVTGCFGLAQQMWHEGVWPGFGGGISVFADRPHISTVRALVINSAFQYAFSTGTGIQRGAQGWGMPELAQLYALRGRAFIVNETDVIAHSQARSYTLHVLPGESTFKATMVYLDPAGNPGAAQARINDLTLRVVSPTLVEYWGNNGLRDGNWSTFGGSANTIDVVENVFVQNPVPGDWLVQVIGTEVVQDARLESPEVDADFGLVVTGVSCYANCDASTTPPVLTANDFQCFLDRFVTGALYANCDGSTVPPILTANDFACFVDRFAGPCP